MQMHWGKEKCRREGEFGVCPVAAWRRLNLEMRSKGGGEQEERRGECILRSALAALQRSAGAQSTRVNLAPEQT